MSHVFVIDYLQEYFPLFSAEQEQREFEAISHVRDSVQMVENAILERDQVCENNTNMIQLFSTKGTGVNVGTHEGLVPATYLTNSLHEGFEGKVPLTQTSLNLLDKSQGPNFSESFRFAQMNVTLVLVCFHGNKR